MSSITDPQDDSITGYRILRADIVDGVLGEFAVLIQDTGTAATTYTDDTVEPETSYVYRVLAINPGGVSEPSSDVEVRTNAPVGPQETPVGEPADNTTGEVDVGGSVTGTIDTDTNKDWFQVDLEAGKTYRFDMEGLDTSRGTLTDPFLLLNDGSGTSITFNDDNNVNFNSRITYAATAAGTHYLEARGSSGRTGTYTLSARETSPTDQVTPPDDPNQPPVDLSDQPRVALHLSDDRPFEDGSVLL